MTVSTTIIKSFGTGDGSTSVFAYQFKIIENSDLQVFIRTNSTGAESAAKQLGTDYSMTGAGVATGGSVTFLSGKIPISGQTVVLRRNVPKTQAIDYIANDPFPAETHEEGLDRGIMVAQQNFEEVERSIKLSKTNTMTSTEFTVGATERANKVLSFDSTGELAVAQELGTFKGNSATTTTAAYAVRDIVKGTTTAQLNNIYICIKASPIGTALTNTTFWVLLVDAVSAATSATAAASSASAASTSATAATNNGAAQVTLATAQVALATTKAGEASTSAGTASTKASQAASSAAAAAASADAFDDVYLGTKSSDPSTDNDGNALAAGMLYFNSTTDLLRVYTGSAWQNAAVDTTGFVTVSGTQTLTNKTLTAPVIASIATVSNGALELAPNGTGTVVVKGNTNSGAIKFNCESNTHGQTLKAQPHSASVTNNMLLPAGADSTLVSLVSADTLTNKTLTSPKINENVAVTSTATELNLLDGVSGLVQADFTKLAAVTSTAAELNILDDATVTTAELNYSDLATLGTTAASKVFTADGNNLTKVSGAVLNVEDTLTDGSTIVWNVINSPVAKVTLGGNRTFAAPSGSTPAAGQFVSLLLIQDGNGSRTITWNSVYEFAADTAPTLTATANKGDLFSFRYNGAKWLEIGRNLALTLS